MMIGEFKQFIPGLDRELITLITLIQFNSQASPLLSMKT